MPAQHPHHPGALKLLALLALVPQLASAGWVTIKAMPPFEATDGSPIPTPTGYVWRSGCRAPGQYEQEPRFTNLPEAQFDGLPDAGRCYFVVAAELRGVLGEFSDEAIWDFDRLAQIPSTPTAGPIVTWVTAPPAPAVTVAISNIETNFTEFDLAIAGAGPVVIELAGLGLFDWCDPDGLGGLGGSNVTPTSPVLGGNNDGSRSKVVTFTAPIARTRCDADAPTSTGYTFSGAVVTVQGVSKPLVLSGSTWRASF